MKFKKLSTFPHMLYMTKISYALQKFIFNNIFLSLTLRFLKNNICKCINVVAFIP